MSKQTEQDTPKRGAGWFSPKGSEPQVPRPAVKGEDVKPSS